MSAAESLDEFLTEYDAPFDDGPGQEPASHWVVDDAATAEWALRKLAGIRRKIAENEAVAIEERSRVVQWLERVNDPLARHAQFFEGLLTTWHGRLLDREPDRKTISLPCGDLKARKQPDRWEFDQMFTDWAQAHRPDLLRVKVDVDKTAAKKTLEAVGGELVVDVDSGEKVPGVTVQPGDVKFTVEARP